MQQTFAELKRRAFEADAHDDEWLGGASWNRVSPELAKTESRLATVRRAKQKNDRVKAAHEPASDRIPLTDPEPRLSPNKEGSFAPNDTPLALIDLESGLILDGVVLQNTDEEQHLVASLEATEARVAEISRRAAASAAFPEPCQSARTTWPLRAT